MTSWLFLVRFDFFTRFFLLLLAECSSSVEIGVLWYCLGFRVRFFARLCFAVLDVDGRGSCGAVSGCFVFFVLARLAMTDSKARILASSVCLESSESGSEVMRDSLSDAWMRSSWRYLWGLLVARFGRSVGVSLVFWRLTDFCWAFGMMDGWMTWRGVAWRLSATRQMGCRWWWWWRINDVTWSEK